MLVGNGASAAVNPGFVSHPQPASHVYSLFKVKRCQSCQRHLIIAVLSYDPFGGGGESDVNLLT